MATLDETNIFETPVTAQEPRRFSPEYLRQRKEQKAEQKEQYKALGQSVRDNLALGNIEQAYESFTQLPVVDQMVLYMTPAVGNVIDAYEAKYFAEKSGRQLKDPEAYQLELLMGGDPREVRPFTQKDPVSGAFSTLAGLSSLFGAGEIPSAIKAVTLPLARRFGMVSRTGTEGGGGGGISGIRPDVMSEDVNQYAREGLRYSPTIKGLIEKAPKNLKGQALLDWMKGNPALAKPKELPYINIQGQNILDYIKNNPEADVRQIVELASAEKPILRADPNTHYGDYTGRDTYIDPYEGVRFDVEVAYDDPLVGGPLYNHIIEDIQDDTKTALKHLDAGSRPDRAKFAEFAPNDYAKELADYYESTRSMTLGLQANRPADMPFDFFDMVEEIDRAKQGGFSDETLDDVIEEYAREIYSQNPYELVTPDVQDIDGSLNFALGNDDTGYSVFVDGERVNERFIGSRNEAQIQLQDALLEAGEIDFESDTMFQQYLDANLGGGRNYREIPVRLKPQLRDELGNFPQHLVSDTVYHILGRNRRLADGSTSFHVDELQSDIHQRANSPTDFGKRGYKTKELDEQFEKLDRERIEFLESLRDKNLSELEKYENYIDDFARKNKTKLTNDGINELEIIKTDIEFYKKNPTINALNDLQRNIVNAHYGVGGGGGGIKKSGLNLDISIATEAGLLDNMERNYRSYLDRSGFNKVASQVQSAVPNYPHKDDWYKKSVEDALIHAIEEGETHLSISGSGPIIERYTSAGNYTGDKFKEMLYDELIPKHMQKLANKYGGKFEKTFLDPFDVRIGGVEVSISKSIDEVKNHPKFQANVIEITDEMKEKITKEGLPAFAVGGKVTNYKSMDKPIMGNTREM